MRGWQTFSIDRINDLASAILFLFILFLSLIYTCFSLKISYLFLWLFPGKCKHRDNILHGNRLILHWNRLMEMKGSCSSSFLMYLHFLSAYWIEFSLLSLEDELLRITILHDLLQMHYRSWFHDENYVVLLKKMGRRKEQFDLRYRLSWFISSDL